MENQNEKFWIEDLEFQLNIEFKIAKLVNILHVSGYWYERKNPWAYNQSA